MTILDTFFILFDSDAEKLDKGLDESEKKSTNLIDKLKEVDKEGAKAGTGLYQLVARGAGLLGIGMSIGALVKGVKETAAAYDELGKLAARFNSTAEAIDNFTDSADLLGFSKETSVGALKALDTAIQDTALGMGRAGRVFDEIGVKAVDAAGKARPVMEVMGDLAAKLSTMEKGAQIRVMERLGLDPALLKLFNADLVNLQKRMADVDKASGFNLEQATKRAAEYTKASKGLALEVNTLKLYLEKLIEGFKVSSMPYFTEAMTTAAKYVRLLVDYLLKHSKFVEGFVIALGAAISYFLIPAAIKGAIAVWAMIAPFALVGIAAMAVAGIFALLYDDIMTFMEGGESMIGSVLQRWPAVGEVLKGIAAEFVFLWDIAKAVFNFLVGMFDDPAAAFEQFKSDVGAGIDALIDHFPGLREDVGDIADAFTSAASVVTDAWDAIIASIKAAIAAVMDGVNTVVSAFNATKSAFGFGGAPAAPSATAASSASTTGVMPPSARQNDALAKGQGMLSQAAASPLTAQTSNSIANSSRTSNKTTTVQVDKIEVKTQATDAEGISKAIGDSTKTQMRQAVANYDDGVLA